MSPKRVKKLKFGIIDIVNLYSKIVGYDNLVSRYNIPKDMFNLLILHNVPLQKQIYTDFMKAYGEYILSLNNLISEYINSINHSDIPDGLVDSLSPDKYSEIYLFAFDNHLSLKLPGITNAFEDIVDVNIIKDKHIEGRFDISVGKIIDTKREDFIHAKRLEQFMIDSAPFQKWIIKYIKHYKARYMLLIYDIEYHNNDTHCIEHIVGSTNKYYPAVNNTISKTITPSMTEIKHVMSRIIFSNYDIHSITMKLYMEFPLYDLVYYDVYDRLIYQRGDGRVIRFDTTGGNEDEQ